MKIKSIRGFWNKFSILQLSLVTLILLSTTFIIRQNVDIRSRAASSSPVGALDDANGYIIKGWASDPDFNGPIYVHVYVDDVLQQDILADMDSGDVGKHRFHWDIPPFGYGRHTVRVYAIGVDANGYPDGNNPELFQSPKIFDIGCNRLQNHELEWCKNNHTYWEKRQGDTKLIWNDYIKVGINNSFGGLITQLYSSDRSKNLLEEHGGSAVQISIYNYDTSKGDVVAWFGQGRCDPTPYTSQQACLSNNSSCVARTWSGGDHVSDCSSVKTCNGVDAGWPWNPIQSIAGNCAWNSSDNNVSYKGSVGSNGWEINHTNFYNYSKTSKFPNLSLNQKVLLEDVYAKIVYTLDYSGPYTMAYHDAELPAFFSADDLNAYYYYYKGTSPYLNPNSAVTRVTNPPNQTGNLAFKEYTGPYQSWDTATERWWGVCDTTETRCITLASFNRDFITRANIEKFTNDEGSYLAPFAYFAMKPGFHQQWEVYVFPYKYDKVIRGKSIRQRIYEIAATYGIHPTITPTNTPKPTSTNTPTPTKQPTNTLTPTKKPTNTPVPTPVRTPGDADGDGGVDIKDYSIWLSQYEDYIPPDYTVNADFNSDGEVGGKDFVIWLTNFGK